MMPKKQAPGLSSLEKAGHGVGSAPGVRRVLVIMAIRAVAVTELPGWENYGVTDVAGFLG